MFGNGLFWRTTLLIGTTTALLAVGCSHDGSGDVAALTPTFSTDVGATPGMAAAPGMSGMPGMSVGGATQSSASPSAPRGPNAIDITNFAFAPATLTVPVGTTVTWTNRDEEPHTVVARDGSFHSLGMGTGNTYTFTFDTAGTFDYVCSIHPFMHGSVTVTK